MSICTLCKANLPEGSAEPWTLPTGEVIQVVRSAMPSVVADTSIGEFEVCDCCYRRGLPKFFTPQDVTEIHYQFGLDYQDRRQFAESVELLTQARHITETADIVAALAYSESELGHREVAITHYRRALEIDPSHFLSRENLKNIDDNPA